MTLTDLQPAFYEGVREFKLLADIEDDMMNQIRLEIDQAHKNNYILTADEYAISLYERQLEIISNHREDLEFRRHRVLNRIQMQAPFTLKFLKEKLDVVIGEGKYVLTMDYDNYTMYLELSFNDANWFKEASLTVNSIKPANIKYVTVPVLFEGIILNECLIISEISRFKIGISRINATQIETSKEREVLLYD